MTTSVRRIAGWLAMVWIFVLLMPAHGAQAAYQTSYGVTYKSSTVNLRQQPTQYSTKLGSYAEGSWMAISGESGNWYYVTAPDGKTGYMSKNFVAVGEEITGPVGIVNNPKSSSFLNLRQEPSYSAKVLGIYYNGVPCVLMDSANGWYNVRVNGQSGYFREEYLTLTTMVYSDQVATIVTPGNSGLNLRAGPGMNYPTLKQFSGGQYVMVLQQGLDWWKVSIGGYVGFMSTSFLKSGILGPSGTSQSGSGGGIYYNGTGLTITNSTIAGNTSTNNGGGVHATVATGTATTTRIVVPGMTGSPNAGVWLSTVSGSASLVSWVVALRRSA